MLTKGVFFTFFAFALLNVNYVQAWTQMDTDGSGLHDGNFFTGTDNDIAGFALWRPGRYVSWVGANAEGFGNENNQGMTGWVDYHYDPHMAPGIKNVCPRTRGYDGTIFMEGHPGHLFSETFSQDFEIEDRTFEPGNMAAVEKWGMIVFLILLTVSALCNGPPNKRF